GREGELRANRRQRAGTGKHPGSGIRYLIERDSIELLDDFVRFYQTAIAEQACGKITRLPPAAFQAHHHARLGERPGALQISLPKAERRFGEHSLDLVMDTFRIAPMRCDVAPEHAAIAEILGTGRNGISKGPLLSKLLEKAR